MSDLQLSFIILSQMCISLSKFCHISHNE